MHLQMGFKRPLPVHFYVLFGGEAIMRQPPIVLCFGMSVSVALGENIFVTLVTLG